MSVNPTRCADPIVVINLDIFENLSARLALRDEGLIGWKTLRFERTEKRFRLGVIITISTAAHA